MKRDTASPSVKAYAGQTLVLFALGSTLLMAALGLVLDAGYTFEQAMRAALKGVLLAPDFLFLREEPGKLDDFALASRLSYFLWSTMPDDELLALAEQNQLGQADVLRGQVERIITLAKEGTLASRRRIVAELPEEPLVIDKLINEIAPRYGDRSSGYTRVVRLGQRAGDAAPIVQLELV